MDVYLFFRSCICSHVVLHVKIHPITLNTTEIRSNQAAQRYTVE
jgi:hypothetical protein